MPEISIIWSREIPWRVLNQNSVNSDVGLLLCGDLRLPSREIIKAGHDDSTAANRQGDHLIDQKMRLGPTAVDIFQRCKVHLAPILPVSKDCDNREIAQGLEELRQNRQGIRPIDDIPRQDDKIRRYLPDLPSDGRLQGPHRLKMQVRQLNDSDGVSRPALTQVVLSHLDPSRFHPQRIDQAQCRQQQGCEGGQPGHGRARRWGAFEAAYPATTVAISTTPTACAPWRMGKRSVPG